MWVGTGITAVGTIGLGVVNSMSAMLCVSPRRDPHHKTPILL